MVSQGQTHLLFAASFIGQRQVVEEGLQQTSAAADTAVGQKGNIQNVPLKRLGAGGTKAFEQAMTEQCFTGARCAGESHDPLAVGQAAEEASDGPFVTGSRIIARRVRRSRKRPLPQVKMRWIDRAHVPRPFRQSAVVEFIVVRTPELECVRLPISPSRQQEMFLLARQADR